MSSRNLSSGQFPTMGESAISVDYRPALKGTRVPRHRGKEVPEPDTAVARTQIHERHGHVGAVQVTRDFSNSPEATSTGHNVHPVPAARGGQAAFDSRRTYAQGC